MMKTIMIPVSRDTSAEKIKKHISLFAKPGIDKLYLMHVVAVPTTIGLMDVMAAGAENMLEEIRIEEEKELKSIAGELQAAGYSIDMSMTVGFFDQEFITKAKEIKPSLILMFTSGSHSFIEDVFGTNTSHVFEKVDSPVLVIPKDAHMDQLKSAVVALNMENEDLTVLKDFFSFSDEFGIEPVFVKIDNNFEMDIINDETVLNQLQKMYPGRIDFIVHRESDDSADGIQQYANETNADIIVLFTTRRNFLEKLFHRSITKDLVLHAKKPLLIYHY